MLKWWFTKEIPLHIMFDIEQEEEIFSTIIQPHPMEVQETKLEGFPKIVTKDSKYILSLDP